MLCPASPNRIRCTLHWFRDFATSDKRNPSWEVNRRENSEANCDNEHRLKTHIVLKFQNICPPPSSRLTHPSLPYIHNVSIRVRPFLTSPRRLNCHILINCFSRASPFPIDVQHRACDVCISSVRQNTLSTYVLRRLWPSFPSLQYTHNKDERSHNYFFAVLME